MGETDWGGNWVLFWWVGPCSVQLLSHVWLFVTPWTAAHQASLSIPKSRSPLKLIESWCHPTVSSSVIPFSCLQSFPASGSFQKSQFFASGGQSIGVSSSESVPQDWFPLQSTGLILLSKGLRCLLQHQNAKASVLQCLPFFMVQLSHPYMTTEKP